MPDLNTPLDPKRILLALDLLRAAEQWRTSYFRVQRDPEDLRTPHEQRTYDSCRTNFGDDAFDLLMDYTEPTE